VAQTRQEDPLSIGRFQHGDRVRITAGPFQGYEGMFDARLGGHMRSRILLDFVGRLTVTELDIRTLEKVESVSVQSPQHV